MSNKLTYEQMSFMHDLAIDTALKELYEKHKHEHGWTLDEFVKAKINYINAIEEGKLQRWVN